MHFFKKSGSKIRCFHNKVVHNSVMEECLNFQGSAMIGKRKNDYVHIFNSNIYGPIEKMNNLRSFTKNVFTRKLF